MASLRSGATGLSDGIFPLDPMKPQRYDGRRTDPGHVRRPGTILLPRRILMGIPPKRNCLMRGPGE